MEGKGENFGAEQLKFEASGFPEKTDDAHRAGGRPAPTWRAWLLSIIAAIVLSVAATLLLGGSSSLRPFSAAGAASSGACGGSCCALGSPGDGGK